MAKIDINIVNSQLYISDVNRIANSLITMSMPKEVSILITGATGLICSAVVDTLQSLTIHRNLDWHIYLAVRNLEKAKMRFANYEKYNNISFIPYNLSEKCIFPEKLDYIIHGAGNAYPALYSQQPVETLTTNLAGLEHILQYAITNKTRVLYISSSEVYGVLHNSAPIKENEYGYVDILNPRSSYSIGKRAGETLCASFISEYGIDCVIARPGHIYGPTASIKDNRVSSDFMYAAAHGNNLILKSKGEQLRSYCYCLDCASAIITILFMGKNNEAYNISNKTSICTIKEMAELFAKAGNVSVEFDLPSEKEKKAFNPMLNSSLDSSMLEGLGWKPVFEKEEGFFHSVQICKELQK